MKKYLIAITLVVVSIVTAQEKPGAVYIQRIADFNARIAAYERHLDSLGDEFMATGHVIEGLKQSRDRQGESEKEVLEVIELVWQLDTLQVEQFKRLLIRYVDLALSIEDADESDQWRFCAMLVYNIRHDLERYTRQPKLRVKKESLKEVK